MRGGSLLIGTRKLRSSAKLLSFNPSVVLDLLQKNNVLVNVRSSFLIPEADTRDHVIGSRGSPCVSNWSTVMDGRMYLRRTSPTITSAEQPHLHTWCFYGEYCGSLWSCRPQEGHHARRTIAVTKVECCRAARLEDVYSQVICYSLAFSPYSSFLSVRALCMHTILLRATAVQ